MLTPLCRLQNGRRCTDYVFMSSHACNHRYECVGTDIMHTQILCVSVYPSLCLSICLSVWWSLYWYASLHVPGWCSYLCTCLSLCLTICLSDCPSDHLSLRLNLCHSVHLSIRLPDCHSVRPSNCMSICHSVHLTICPSDCLTVTPTVHPSVWLSYASLCRWARSVWLIWLGVREQTRREQRACDSRKEQTLTSLSRHWARSSPPSQKSYVKPPSPFSPTMFANHVFQMWCLSFMPNCPINLVLQSLHIYRIIHLFSIFVALLRSASFYFTT